MAPAESPFTSPYTPHRERKPLPKADDVEYDKRSMISHSSGVPRAEHGYDALRHVAGNRVRHARCAPEFLEEISTRGVQFSLKKSPHRRFKIINGSEARSYFKDYIRDHTPASESMPQDGHAKMAHETMPSPIVFAVTVWEASVKCVDYYMTWRGKMNQNQGKESELRATFLDSEFRTLAKGLDKEYKAISSLRNFGNLSQGTQKFEKKPSHSSSQKSRPPPGITVSTPEDPSPKLATSRPTLPEPPVSATDSVMSLPLLNMIRGVPFSHRVPLKVANPDRLSLISYSSIAPEEAKETDTDKPPNPNVSNSLAVPVASRPSKHDRSSDVHGSSASIRSSDTRSSQSSRSSRSSSRSENRDYSRHPSPDDHHDRTQSREIPEFLIVLLGDKFDNDPTSWHGLERQTSIRSLPADRHSPWIVPLVRSESITHRFSPTLTPNDSESEESDNEVGWKNSPVIPMKPLMEAMGFIPNSTYYHSSPVVPGGLQYQLSVANANSPARTSSPYLYGSPRMEASPYVPAWHPQLHVTNNAPSRAASHAYSSSPYTSPYMQSHTGQF